jgi:energy-coupling factor transporter ATP-binding protein EcfA2
MNWQETRKNELEENLCKAVQLLSESERQLLYTNDQLERGKIEYQVALTKKQLMDFQQELDGLTKSEIPDNTLVQTSDIDQDDLTNLIERAHLLKASKSSFVQINNAIEITKTVLSSKLNIDKQVRKKIEEDAKKLILEQVIMDFEEKIRGNIPDSDISLVKDKVKEEIKKKEISKFIRNEVSKLLEAEMKKPKTLEKIKSRIQGNIQTELTLKKKIELIAIEAKLSVEDIQLFVDGEPIETHVFRLICSHLDLEYYSVIDKSFLEALMVSVPQVRMNRRSKIQEQCGTLRILDFSRPIELNDLYVDVNILREPNSNRFLEIEDMPKIYNPETDTMDRFGLGEISQPRVAGMGAIKKYSRLMILGKPGAGKSTFLQHLAIQCNQGEINFDRIPIFVRLKTFAEDANNLCKFNLLEFIVQELSEFEFLDRNKIDSLLIHGRIFLLMDGLDEVAQKDSDEVVKSISNFCEKYHRNKFVITCRIAAQRYNFSKFTYVEVADFNQEQIEDFSKKFFVAVDTNPMSSGLKKASEFIKELEKPENLQIREISITPILLTLTCLVFMKRTKFPTNRAELYHDGIEILLSKWDESRRIKRDYYYKDLTPLQKKELLAYIASSSFETNMYFLKKEEIINHISLYFAKIEQANVNKGKIGAVVLESIEVQHGLLVERAHNIYSFSHLTFQEYFTATKFIDCNLHDSLSAYVIAEKRWREVFLLATDLVTNSDEILWLTKLKVDQLVDSNNKIQRFLDWLNRKANSSIIHLEPVAIRAYHLSLSIEYYSNRNKLLDEKSSVVLRNNRSLENRITIVQSSHRTLSQEKSLINILCLASRLLKTSYSPQDFSTTMKSLIRERTLSLIKLIDDNALWLPQIRAITIKLPNRSSSSYVFCEWWSISGVKWTEEFRSVITKHCDIGYEWDFSESQIELLKQYYSSNEYLITLLDDVQNITSGMRSQIRETILLPVNDILEYKKLKNISKQE